MKNPRKNIDELFAQKDKLTENIRQYHLYETGKVVVENDFVPLHLLDEKELNIQYGGGNFHWFKNEELK